MINLVQSIHHIAFSCRGSAVQSCQQQCWLHSGLSSRVSLLACPFLTDRSQGMATGKRRMADELNSACPALCSSVLRSELQMLQHLAWEREHVTVQTQHCSAETTCPGQKVYASGVLHTALFLPFFFFFPQWMRTDSSSPPVWLTGF